MKNQLLDIQAYDGEGIGGATAYGDWQVLLLNYLPRLAPDQISDMQRHTQTDEIFLLLTGHAILFTAEGDSAPCGRLYATVLEPGKLYRVPKNVWHSQAMTKDAKIALVENRNTVVENSPRHPLDDEQRAQLLSLVPQCWPC